MNTPSDPRAADLAQHGHRLAREDGSDTPAWEDPPDSDPEKAVRNAGHWLRVAVDAGIAPAADRPTLDWSD
ncbi:hypothetical protein [Streptomyces sp. MN6]